MRKGIHFVKSQDDLNDILANGFKPGPGMGNWISFYHEGNRPRDFGLGRKYAVIITFDPDKGGNPQYEGGIQSHHIKNIRQATPEEIASWGKPMNFRSWLESIEPQVITPDDIQVGDQIATTGGRRVASVSGTVTKVNRVTIVITTTYMDKPMELKLNKWKDLDGELRILRNGKVFSSVPQNPAP